MSWVEAVALRFGLGPVEAVQPMPGMSNRLWRVDAGGARYVAKELLHVGEGANLADRRSAAAFELAVFAAGVVEMPEPVVATSGEVLELVDGSRGRRLAARVHRWAAGEPAPRPAPAAVCRDAGAALAAVQAFGARWSWPDEHADRVIEPNRSMVVAMLDALAVGSRLRDAVVEALALVEEGMARPEPCATGCWPA